MPFFVASNPVRRVWVVCVAGLAPGASVVAIARGAVVENGRRAAAVPPTAIFRDAARPRRVRWRCFKSGSGADAAAPAFDAPAAAGSVESGRAARVRSADDEHTLTASRRIAPAALIVGCGWDSICCSDAIQEGRRL